MKRTFVRLSRAKSANCWLRSGEKSSISKGSRPTCIRVIANCKIDFGRHVFTALHFRTNEANRFQCVKSCPTLFTLPAMQLAFRYCETEPGGSGRTIESKAVTVI